MRKCYRIWEDSSCSDQKECEKKIFAWMVSALWPMSLIWVRE
jgi:ribonuclease I